MLEQLKTVLPFYHCFSRTFTDLHCIYVHVLYVNVNVNIYIYIIYDYMHINKTNLYIHDHTCLRCMLMHVLKSPGELLDSNQSIVDGRSPPQKSIKKVSNLP